MSEDREISLVLGTAGHIDHGKTTLIAALTGVDCDRLLEEKKRGITIELGFAPLRLEDGRVVSVIDVPGHERFIRQMVAGASGIDAVLLIVSADEGVMPQTREHLAILDLLGVRDGLVAITKTDRVEPGMADLAREDVQDFVRGTFLEDKPIVPVSAVTGDNLEALKRELAALVDRVRPRARKGALFLPIDRAFPISGFGTVVTGTAYRGIARPGDEIEVFPSGREGRVRSLQVHGRSVEEAFAGQRVAVNLSGIAVDQLARGDVVCRKGVYSPTRCFDALLRVLPSASEPVKHWQRVRLCIGTSDILARVSLLRTRTVVPGEEEPAQLVLEEPVVCTADQRFIIRFYSPLITIGGGRVVFPYSHKPRGAAARTAALSRIGALASAATSDERLRCLVTEAGMMDAPRAAIAVQEAPSDLAAVVARLVKAGDLVELKGERPLLLSPSRFASLEAEALAEVEGYQKAFPSEAGMPLDELMRRLSLTDAKVIRALAGLLAERSRLVVEDNKARTPDFVVRSEGEFRRNSEALASFCRARGWQLATLEEVRSELRMEPNAFTQLIQSLKNTKGLALLDGGYVLTAEMENAMLDILRGIGGNVTLAAVRDATNSSRKFILPVLEYFDSKGYTRRVGDVRVVKGAVK